MVVTVDNVPNISMNIPNIFFSWQYNNEPLLEQVWAHTTQSPLHYSSAWMNRDVLETKKWKQNEFSHHPNKYFQCHLFYWFNFRGIEWINGCLLSQFDNNLLFLNLLILLRLRKFTMIRLQYLLSLIARLNRLLYFAYNKFQEW